MPEPPITLIARKEVFRNTVFTVYADHIRDAAGNEVRDYLRVVPHQRAVDGVTGIAVLPVLEGRFGLIRIYRHPIGDHCWEAARGFVDANETPAAAAVRELREETGLDAGAWRDLGTLAPEPGLLDARVRLFAAEGCRRMSGAAESEVGHGDMRFFGRAELLGMVGRSEIVDPCTLVCAYRYLGAAR